LEEGVMMVTIHQGQRIAKAGVPLTEAKAAMVMLHGRGATAESILTLTNEFDAQGFAYLAPQAAGNTWYPNRFIEPIESNEPYLSSALATVGDVLKQIEDAGIPPEKMMLLGFSQGACLSLEFAARRGGRLGGVAGLSGGLIGATLERSRYAVTLNETPVFLGCSDVDFHVPKVRVEESAVMLREIGADTTMRLYQGMGHTVNADEIAFVNQLMAKVING
jgi:phospholipase/carboxylesterase